MFTTELFLEEDEGLRCNGSYTADVGTTAAPVMGMSTVSPITTDNSSFLDCSQLTSDDYRDAFVQSVAELPVRCLYL